MPPEPPALPRMEPQPNGPYLVRGLRQLSNSLGQALPTNTVMALCRCGHSANKPFCDGSHARVGFDSRRTTDGQRDRSVSYTAGRLIVHDNRGICAHAGHCTDGLPAVFRSGEEPWIDPMQADEAAIVALVRRCPSGALSCSVNGTPYGDMERGPAILVSKNGPYEVTGRVELAVDHWGDGASREHYTLCRCGRSANKPFCDGSHWDGFEDDRN